LLALFALNFDLAKDIKIAICEQKMVTLPAQYNEEHLAEALIVSRISLFYQF